MNDPSKAVFIAPLVAFCLYYNTLDAGFVYDDRRAILTNEDVRGDRPIGDAFLNDFWGTRLSASGSHGSYRPLVVLSFRWTGGHRDPFWQHLINVLLHCGVTSLVARMAGREALEAGLLFAVHPVHCEAVAGLVGRADVVCTLFFLLGLDAYSSHAKLRQLQHSSSRCWAMLALSVFFTLVAFLSKEYGIMLPVVCIIHDIFQMHRPSPRQVINSSHRWYKVVFTWTVLAMTTFALVIWRLSLSDFRLPSPFSSADNPTAKSNSFATRTLTFLYLPVFHFGLLVLPRWLSFDWSMNTIPPIQSLVSDWRNLSTVIFYIILICNIRLRSQSHENVNRIVLMVVPFLPATNLVTYVGLVAGERLVYLPSVAFCLLVAAGIHKLKKYFNQTSYLINILYLILVLSLAQRTRLRNKDWKNEISLYSSAIPINPPKAYGNLGVILHDAGRLAEAEWCYKQALAFRPNMADVLYNLGNLYQQQERYYESLRAYDAAITIRPRLAEAYNQKARVLLKLNREESAEETLAKCTGLSGEWQRDQRSHDTAKADAALLLTKVKAKNVSYSGRQQQLADANWSLENKWLEQTENEHFSTSVVNPN